MRVIVVSSDIKHVSGIRFPESIELSIIASSSEAVVQSCSVKKGALEISQNLPESTCQSLFFNKAVGLKHANLLKKSLWRRCFPVNFWKFLRAPFLLKHLWWLLLHYYQSNYPKLVAIHEGLPIARNY